MRLSAPADETHRLGVDGGGVLERRYESVRPSALGRAGYAAEVAHVGYAVEKHYERRLVVGYALQNIGQLHILDGGDLRHGSFGGCLWRGD